MLQQVVFGSATVNYYFQSTVQALSQWYPTAQTIFITDQHIAALYPQVFLGRKILVVPAGEQSKTMDTITSLSAQLLQLQAGRDTILVGIGGGVITDITGFLASIYKRGVRFGFVPTSLLAMVDAAVGGKNGVNLDVHKNVIGTIRQPEFILFDTSFLGSLPPSEWSNGFAEIIKYACIFDESLFAQLAGTDLSAFQYDFDTASQVIARCVAWKNQTVQADEHEHGQRKLLNFGHTVAHAIENTEAIAHGQAVSIGMVVACGISAHVAGLDPTVARQLKALLQQYGLPAGRALNADRVMDVLRNDKKRKGDDIDYIVLEKIGRAAVMPLPLSLIDREIRNYDSNH